ELVDDGIGRLGGDDSRLRDADIAAVPNALLGVADGGAFHRPFHGARAAAGAYAQGAQSELVTHALGVIVFRRADRMSAPAHDQIRLALVIQKPRVAQDVVHRIGDASRIAHVEALAAENRIMDVHDV